MFSWLIKFLWYLFTGVLALLLIFLALLQTQKLHHEAIQIVTHLIEQKTNARLTLENSGGVLPFTLTADKVIIEDVDNNRMEAKNIHLAFSPLSLFRGTLGLNYSLEVIPPNFPFLKRPIPLHGKVFIDLKKKQLIWGTINAGNEEIEIHGKFTIEDGVFSLTDFNCTIYEDEKKLGELSAKGSRHKDGKCLGQILLHIPLLNKLPLQGAIHGSYQIEGDNEGIRIVGHAQTTHPLSDLVLYSEVNFSGPKETKASLTLTGNALELPIAGKANLEWESEGKTMHISQASISYPYFEFNADLSYDVENKIVDGQVAGNFRELAPLFSPIFPSIDGSFNFKALFSCSQEKQQYISLSFNGKNLSFADLNLSSLALSCEYQQGVYSPFQLSATTGENSLDVTGIWGMEQKGIDFSVQALKGWIKRNPIELTKPFMFRIAKQQLLISDLELKIANGSLIADVQSHQSQTKALLQAKDIPIEIFSSFSPYSFPLEGLFSFDVNLTKISQDLNGTILILANQLKVQQAALTNFPELQAKLEGSLKDNHLQFDGYLETLKGVRPVVLKGNIPFIFQNPLHFNVDTSSPLDLHVNAEGEIAHLLRLFMENTISISGRTKVGIDISGNFPHPQVLGFLEVQNGSYEDLDTGAAFQNLTARFEGDQNQLVIKELHADDGKKGSVSAAGKIELDLKNYFPFSIDLDIQDALLVHLDYARATASGKVSLSGNFLERTWKGELTISKAEVTLPEETPPQLKAIEVNFLNQPEADSAYTQFRQKKRTTSTHFQVTLNIPAKAYLKGRDLKSEWHGSIAISGTVAQPLLEGKLQLISGSYLFNGRTFISHQGDIIFAGEPGKKTTLYIVAEEQIDRMKVEAILKGPIYSPKLTFRSNPPLSEKEILSWILFNRGLSDITPMQGAKLSQTVFTVSGGKDGSDVLSKIRHSIGIDRIDISSTDKINPNTNTNEVSLHVGKYISKGAFVSVSRNITTESHQIGIEANMMRHVKVKGEVGDNSEGNLSLKWTYDY